MMVPCYMIIIHLCANGGHALGTLDAPWLHTMLCPEYYERYFKEMNPNECYLVLPWIKNALNRKITIAFMQRTLVEEGFNIYSWHKNIGKPKFLKGFDPAILEYVHQHQADVTLADLIATSINFIAVPQN